jgi:hypothetical protein
MPEEYKKIKKKVKCDFCERDAEFVVGDYNVCGLHVRKAEIESGIYEQG